MASFQAISSIVERLPLPLETENPVDSADSEALQRLRQHRLFKDFSKADFDFVASRTKTMTLGHQEVLYRQDTAASHFYFVVSGRLRLYRLDCTGLERTLDAPGPGDCFAEVIIYANPARYACYASSLKRSEVLIIPIQAYRSVLKANPAYTETLLTHYASRAVERLHDLEIMTVQSARERLVRYLIDLLPDPHATQGEVELPLPKCLVASRLGMQPETFSRLLNELRSKGLVEVKRDRLHIPDPQRLIKLSH